jgi:hypothetical protein
MACTGNLLQNWSFELPLVSGQNIPYWYETPQEGNILQGSGYQVDGQNNAFIGPHESLYQQVSVQAGETYTLTFWAGSHNPQENEAVSLVFVNRQGVSIARGLLNVQIDYDVDNDITPPYLMQYSLQGSVPANAVAVRVFVRNQGNNTLNFDAACLTK